MADFGAVAAVQRERRRTRRWVLPQGERAQRHIPTRPYRIAGVTDRDPEIGCGDLSSRWMMGSVLVMPLNAASGVYCNSISSSAMGESGSQIGVLSSGVPSTAADSG